MRRLLASLVVLAVAGCGGKDAAPTALKGECAAGKTLSFAPLSAATVKAALGGGPLEYGGLVFPREDSRVPAAGDCAYFHDVDGPRLTVALNRRTDFFRSFAEARRFPRTHRGTAPITGFDGYTVTRGGSTWAVVTEGRGRIVWARLETPEPPADATAVTVAALRQAVPAFHAPMKARP